MTPVGSSRARVGRAHPIEDVPLPMDIRLGAGVIELAIQMHPDALHHRTRSGVRHHGERQDLRQPNDVEPMRYRGSRALGSDAEALPPRK
jgi:hypothetical protein